jgi:hypothetical protein
MGDAAMQQIWCTCEIGKEILTNDVISNTAVAGVLESFSF